LSRVTLNSQIDGPFVLAVGCSKYVSMLLIAKVLGSFLVLCFQRCKVFTTFSLIAEQGIMTLSTTFLFLANQIF
jgi:hypothetical protein